MAFCFVIIGGGAAGIFCAVNLARFQPKAKIIVLEKTNKLLAKVKISGGGRCNVTHNCNSISQMSSCYPRGEKLVQKSFKQFFTNDTIEWFKKRGVPIVAEADGRMFPQSNTSQTIIDCLLAEANQYNVNFEMQTQVNKIDFKNNHWTIETNKNTITADAVCLALGGYPKLEQYNWLTNLQHKIVAPLPSLFTFNIPNKTLNNLLGSSVTQAQVKIISSNYNQLGPLQVTHWGVSGPAVLKLSAFAARYIAEKNYHFQISINWANKNYDQIKDEFDIIRKTNPTQKLGKPFFNIASRLWDYFLLEANIDKDIFWASLSGKHQKKLIDILSNNIYTVSGKTTFKEEFVTCGGFDIHEINEQTMQSKLHKNLFFAGEVMNVDGITGGYNFQHAWTSGFIAAQNMALV